MSKINQIIEYFSLSLVLSFFLFHNIYIVILGIVLSILIINKTIIFKYLTSYKSKKLKMVSMKECDLERSESNIISLSKVKSQLTLVESVEELGYIPSKKDCNERNVAS